MGLDMYLTAKRYLWAGEDADTRRKIKNLTGSSMQPKSVEFDALYWRKANAIHKWFVDNVQNGEDNCQEYFVPTDMLKNLVFLLKKILDDKALAPKLLPTTEGFFFGGTEYDEYYWEEVERTHDALNALLSAPDGDKYDYHYQSSW